MKTLTDRFEEKVERIAGVDCHLWTAAIDSGGYGTFKANSKMEGAHRVAYELYVEPIPYGMQVLHRCDVRPCVNPEHLFLGTNADNVADKVAKGRQLKGESHYKVKLTEADVITIRDDQRTCREIAVDYEIGHTQVSRIKHRARWKHIP